MITDTAQLLNKKLDLSEGSILKNILCSNCKEINEVISERDLKELEEYFNNLLLLKDSFIENPYLKKQDSVKIFIGQTLNSILDCWPELVPIGGLIFYDIKAIKNKDGIFWNITNIDRLLE